MEAGEAQLRENGKDKTHPTRSLLNLSEKSSAARIRTLELNEYCKNAKINLKTLRTKIQSVTTTKSEAIRTRNELVARQKLNFINLKSMLQTRSEFYSYKCDMKTNYILREATLKTKKIEYNAFTSSYSNKWDKAEEEHKKIPMASAIFIIQKDNTRLNAEMVSLQSLLIKTREDYLRVINNYQNSLIEKMVEFVKECKSYFQYLNTNHHIRNCTIQLNEQQHLDNALNRNLSHKVCDLRKKAVQIDFEKEANVLNLSKDSVSAYLTAFDNVLIPFENLPPDVLEVLNNDLYHNSKDVLANLDTRFNEINGNYKEIDFPYEKSTCTKGDIMHGTAVGCESSNRNCIKKTNQDKELALEKNSKCKDEKDSISINALASHDVEEPSLADETSQYWTTAQNVQEFKRNESSSKKNSKIRSCTLDEVIESNSKKKKYFKRDGDVGTSTVSSANNDNSVSVPDVKNNTVKEFQMQQWENVDVNEKFVNGETSNDLFNLNQAYSTSNDNSGKVKFSFLSAGDDRAGTKSEPASSIFTLF